MSDIDVNTVIRNLMENTERMLTTKRVIGEPFQVGNITLIPIMTATVGVGAGGGSGKGPSGETKSTGEGTGGGGGLGMRLVPTALVAVVEGELRVFSLGGRGALEKVLDLVPDLIQKVGSRAAKADSGKATTD